ncbi:LysR family transcriptional regulator [Musicola keenii]|uniref:LysR family transcriptional regulator n=1 Tax=Musicola keenii TaxID=2884250 RepID=UPI001782A940|nr:LysR family transcriptional regulator [Musicola keenii]
MNKINIETMDLNLFKVFEALYEEGGAGRAALRLGVTQSAISAALGRMRNIYGDRLFERTGRGLRPTRRADELHPIISDALNKCRQSLSMANSVGDEFQGRTVTMGWSDDYEIALARTLTNQVAAEYPGIRLIFRQTHSRVAADMLMERAVDLAISTEGFSSSILGRQVLGGGSYACLLDNRPDAPDALTLEEYIRRRHILVSSGGFIGIVDEALAALGLQRRIEVSTTHFAAVPYLLKGSESLVTLPAHAAYAIAAIADLRVLPCPLVLPGYAVELGWRLDALRDPAVVAVRQAVQCVFAELRSDDEYGLVSGRLNKKKQPDGRS